MEDLLADDPRSQCALVSPQIVLVPLTVLILAEDPAPWTHQSKPVHRAFLDTLESRGTETLSASVRSSAIILSSYRKNLLACFPLPLSPLLFPSPLSSIFSSHLPAVCSGAPDCTALNRYPCSEVPNTCGRCFSRHLGVEGFSNESCFGMSLYNQTRAPSSINQSSFSLSQIESAQTPFRNIDFSERG